MPIACGSIVPYRGVLDLNLLRAAMYWCVRGSRKIDVRERRRFPRESELCLDACECTNP